MAVITYTVPGLGITAPDNTPDAFTFVDQTDVALSTLITSEPIIVKGITLPTVISISGTNDPEYQVLDNAWKSVPSVLYNGWSVRVRHTSAAFNGIPIDTVVTIGGVSDTFTSTTLQAPDTTVAWDGLTIPEDSLLYQDGGQATGGSATTGEDSTKTWVLNEFIDFKYRDTSDGSEGIITGNTTDGTATFSGGLTGGNNNTVSADHYWEIVVDLDAGDEINFNLTTNLGGTVAVSAKGVPSVTGISGDHTIVYSFTDVSTAETSPNYNLVIAI